MTDRTHHHRPSIDTHIVSFLGWLTAPSQVLDIAGHGGRSVADVLEGYAQQRPFVGRHSGNRAAVIKVGLHGVGLSGLRA